MKILKTVFPIFFCLFYAAFALGNDSISAPKIVLFPFQKATISSFVNSYILKYNFKEGQVFKKGDVIIELQDIIFKEGYAQELAEFNKQKALLEFSKSEYSENKELFDKEALSQQELKKSKMDYDFAKAGYNNAKANLVIANYRLTECIIKAPYDGRIVQKMVYEFEYVNNGIPIVKIINDTKLLAVMHISSDDIKNFKVGQNVTFFIDEADRNVIGQVYELGGEVDSISRTYEIKALIDNKDRKLLAGMSGHYVVTN